MDRFAGSSFALSARHRGLERAKTRLAQVDGFHLGLCRNFFRDGHVGCNDLLHRADDNALADQLAGERFAGSEVVIRTNAV